MKTKDFVGKTRFMILTYSPKSHLLHRLHSETQVLKTLFGLLFWDILFADIPGAFETAFQKAPLDIVEDSFYYARQSLIDDRLREIREGKSKEIVKRHDDKYREKKTMCLCVNWDFCTTDDLMEMIEASNLIFDVQISNLNCDSFSAWKQSLWLSSASCFARIIEAEVAEAPIYLFGIRRHVNANLWK